jgi:pimeloyl-ACP methyl ester carboxylesterase
MMIRISTCAFALFLFCSAINAAVNAPPSLALRECRLQSATTGGGVAARCGAYVVRENRADRASKELRIHVAVIPALRVQPEPDALFILSGGPGHAASDFYLSVAPAFARIRRDRDIVLVDQRGTGRSNRLDCDFPDEAEIAQIDIERLRAAARACIARLPGDPRHYTTSIAVRDLDDVRAALGYQSISIYGASYGTRVAQHYMRRYPQRVRAAILDGVAPAGLALGPDVAPAAQRALDATFARCAADERCVRQFPNIAQRFDELRRRLRQDPVQLAIADPLTAEPTTATLGDAQLSAAIRLLTYTDETASLLPLLIHEAQVGARPHALAAQYLMIRRTMTEQIAQGMHFAVVCSEDAPRWPHEDDATLATTYMGESFMQAMRAICAVWPRGAVDSGFDEPLRTSTPTLMLSGGNDPATPEQYAAQILPGFANAKHLVLAGQGHGQIATGCVPRVAADFIAAGSVAELDDACVNAVSPAPFMLSLTASAP